MAVGLLLSVLQMGLQGADAQLYILPCSSRQKTWLVQVSSLSVLV